MIAVHAISRIFFMLTKSIYVTSLIHENTFGYLALSFLMSENSQSKM